MYPNRDNYYMQVNGLKAQINTPEALMGEGVHALPPYAPVEFYPVDEYPGCPDNWMHGSDKASSYFIPVEVGKGMWFNFTPNAAHTHDVAVVISVQGINPVTGQQVTALNLEHFKTRCPVHDVEFQQDRYCPECGYKWPAQNYISTTTGQPLWIDGFRNAEGLVRQYILTEEECRGVAAQKIGEDRVWAIGFAFYLSKKAKPRPNLGGIVRTCGSSSWTYSGDVQSLAQYASGDANLDIYYPTQVGPDGVEYSLESAGPVPSNINIPPIQMPCVDAPQSLNMLQAFDSAAVNKNSRIYPPSNSISPSIRITEDDLSWDAELKDEDYFLPVRPDEAIDSPVEKVEVTKKVEIGAGANIEQELGVDPNDLDYWQDEPVGMIYVNYVTRDVCQRILDAGKRQDKVEGPLQNLKVGN